MADLTVVDVPLDELHPDPANPRKISDADLDALTRSIRGWGFLQPVLARREGGIVIGGHQRLIAARRLGWKTAPTIWLDVTADQARALNLALNRISGEWDDQLLERLLAELAAVPDIDLSLTGFGEEEIARYLRTMESREKRDRVETFDVETALERARGGPVSARGDVWVLGDHRLLCGDSTDAGDVERLFAGGEMAALMATDPPYLVDYDGGNHPTTKANKGASTKDKHWDAYDDPELSVAFYASFLRIGLVHLQPNSAVYQWFATKRFSLVEQAWREVDLLVHQTLIWKKARGVLTRSHYMWDFEPCLYGWVEGKPPTKKPPGGERTVWEIDQVGAQMDIHPTQKPLAIFEKPINFHTEPGAIVYEPFSGSGTQIIAAERLGRRCFAIELQPVFVDVAVARWEAFTGRTAVREPAPVTSE